MGIRYFHFKALTPSQTTRDVQAKVDAKARVAKRKRDSLSDEFIATYKADVLAHFNPVEFVKQFDDSVQTIVLFCVEREPSACHQSLLAQKSQRRFRWRCSIFYHECVNRSENTHEQQQRLCRRNRT